MRQTRVPTISGIAAAPYRAPSTMVSSERPEKHTKTNAGSPSIAIIEVVLIRILLIRCGSFCICEKVGRKVRPPRKPSRERIRRCAQTQDSETTVQKDLWKIRASPGSPGDSSEERERTGRKCRKIDTEKPLRTRSRSPAPTHRAGAGSKPKLQ